MKRTFGYATCSPLKNFQTTPSWLELSALFSSHGCISSLQKEPHWPVHSWSQCLIQFSSVAQLCLMCSAYKFNKQGDNIQPWRTPFPVWNQSIVPRPVLTLASWPAYRFLRTQVRWSGIPICWRIFHNLLWSTVKGFRIVSEAEVDVFSGIPLLSLRSYKFWQFDLWPLYLFQTQLVHLEAQGSHTVEAGLTEFWALIC